MYPLHHVIYSKEYRFLLTPTQPLVGVVSEIRRQTGLKDDTPFNLKWLDVEGEDLLPVNSVWRWQCVMSSSYVIRLCNVIVLWVCHSYLSINYPIKCTLLQCGRYNIQVLLLCVYKQSNVGYGVVG